MWRITILANVAIITLSWILGLIALAIVDNRFVEYADGDFALPQLTHIALTLQWWLGLLPLGWFFYSLFLLHRVKTLSPEKRHESLLALSVLTIAIGMTLFCFCSLAGILPFLYIGSSL